MTEPRKFDLMVRSMATAAIAILVTLIAAYQAVNQGHITPELGAWGGVIIGFYFGSHASLNGSGVRATDDREITRELLQATPPPPAAVPTLEDPSEAPGV